MPKLQNDIAGRFAWGMAVTLIVLAAPAARAQVNPVTFNVRNFGATGRRSDNARVAIQKAIDACATAGGGQVVLTAGEYTSGTIHLRNHVTLEIEAGATLYASEEDREYDKPALIYGEDIQNISIQGRGTIDGQGDCFSKAGPDDDININDN